MSNSPHQASKRVRSGALALCAAAALAACGGASAPEATPLQAAAPLATGVTTLSLETAVLPADAAALIAQPAFHAAPLLLDEPDDTDVVDHAASAHRPPRTQAVPAALAGLSTRRLTVQALQSAARMNALGVQGVQGDGSAVPMAGTSVVATYSPAQIRAAYGLPALPAAGATLTPAQAAQLGAGQTIYIVDAMHDPNVAAELAAFNTKFGLPGCTTKVIAASASLPLAAASASACEFAVVYSTASGTRSTTAPAYDAGWATEITLDVQWAHATAPLARIVLIEAADASLNGLLGAIKLANAMGPGVVSMSFGGGEGSYTASVDAAFTAANMSYLAATGDSGAAVSWPSVSPNVVAVGGTTLTYSGSGTRSESTWSGTGGGTSAYTAAPSYQNASVPGMGSVTRRSVADVAFNADPSSGQYVAVQTPGSTAVNWISVGGTSLATPQWAGVVAVVNAVRAQATKPALGLPHAALYGQVAAIPGTYASAFADVTKGSNGNCGACAAKSGYDTPTGLGTPNVASLLTALGGAVANALPPVVAPAAISGKVGTALSFTVAVTAPNPVSYTLGGAPSGMAISTAGAVTWATPVAGTYAVTVTAKDSKTGLSGQGVYTVTIAPPAPPVVTAAAVSGKVGTALSYTVSVAAPNAVTYALTGAPSGTAISTAGVLSWAVPVAGTYGVTVVAKDSKTGLSGQGVITVTIAAVPAPAVAGGTVTGKPGTALSFTVGVTASNPVTYTLGGAPSGMSISTAGLVSWASPVAGNYTVTVVAKDSKTGLSGQGVYTVQIASAGPVIAAAAMSGVAGKAMSGTITVTDPGVASISVSISGAPLGMSFSASGLTIKAAWASPVAGSYTLKVAVTDSAGKSAAASVPITVTAK